jgi:hypothetical protein
MPFRRPDAFLLFKISVLHDQRYAQGKDARSFLRAVEETSVKRIRAVPAKTALWRAQVGNEAQEVEVDNFGPVRAPVPFGSQRMKPISTLAADGRVNPRGIAYLYLASNSRTACSEVRPWRGALISLGQFETVRGLSIVDCTLDRKMCPFKRFNTAKGTGLMWGPEDYERLAWGEICDAMSVPVPPESTLLSYVPTQIIAERFRISGADGIAYKSLLAKGGVNYALFDPNDADLVSCKLVETKAIHFSFSAFQSLADPN